MIRILSRSLLLAALLAALVLASTGPGYRLGWWPLSTAFGILRIAGWVAVGVTLAGLVIAIVAAFVRPGGSRAGLTEAIATLVVGSLTMAGPIVLLARAKAVPPIHDITTDTGDPPQFHAVLSLRAGAPNPATYGGPTIAEQQRKAYPRVVPLELGEPPAQAFERALGTARDMGWTIVSTDAAAGSIEATTTTPFFGFRDDIVVRISASPKGSRIDVRSVSRLGRSDLGTNARRIESYLDKVASN